MSLVPPEGRDVPGISVVLATGSLRAARRALDAYRHQTVAGRIEVVMVAPRAELAHLAPDAAGELWALSAVEAESPFDLARARAAGALAARAPWVFIGETHSFADPTLIARLLASGNGMPAGSPPQGLIPCIYNVNPSGAVSWASFLIDYGAWGPGHADGQPIAPAIYNGAFRRELFGRLGAELPTAMSPHDDAVAPLTPDREHWAIFVASARIGHLNVVRLADFVRSKRLLGAAIGEARARRWRWPRRLAYAAASPLIAGVLLSRYLSVFRLARGEDRIPIGVLPLLSLGALVRAVGEAAGYLGSSSKALAARLDHLEIHKADYVPGWEQ